MPLQFKKTLTSKRSLPSLRKWIPLAIFATALAAVAVLDLPYWGASATSKEPIESTIEVQTLKVADNVVIPPLERDSYEVEAPPPPPPVDPDSAKAYAQSIMGEYGWGDDQFNCLVDLWNRESGWRWDAINPNFSPSREAIPENQAYGIPQSGPGSKMSSAGADWKTNPQTQIRWGIGYIEGRYGSPCGAWAHSEANNWY